METTGRAHIPHPICHQRKPHKICVKHSKPTKTKIKRKLLHERKTPSYPLKCHFPYKQIGIASYIIARYSEKKNTRK